MRHLAVVLLLVIAIGSACADDEPDVAQPAPHASSFTIAGFDELPLAPGSQRQGGPTDVGDATTASYLNGALPPDEILGFYARELPPRGWTVVKPPEGSSHGVWRGDWLKEGRRLEVVATRVDTAADGRDVPTVPTSQYSLVLNDDRADNPVFTSTLPERPEG